MQSLHKSKALPLISMILLILGVWLGGSLLMDFLVMPSLYSAGMMDQPGFAAAGYSLGEAVNHMELLLAALVLTGSFTVCQLHPTVINRKVMGGFGVALLVIAALSTYVFTPWISGLGLWAEGIGAPPLPLQFSWVHGIYLLLEVGKLALLAGSIHLLRICLVRELSSDAAVL